MADANVQPVPWVLRVSTRGAASRRQLIGLDEKIDAFRPAAVSAFDQHRSRAKCQQLLALGLHFVFVTRG